MSFFTIDYDIKYLVFFYSSPIPLSYKCMIVIASGYLIGIGVEGVSRLV